MNFFRSRQTILGWLLLATFALRATVPIGYMIGEVAKATTVTITICGGSHTKSPDEPAKNTPDTPCPFSINVLGLNGGWPPPAQLFLSFILIGLISFAALHLGARRMYGNASPRAPPRGLLV
jgi:hypothetical protein